jgi:hypothetical protein
VLDAFLEIESEIVQIAARFRDADVEKGRAKLAAMANPVRGGVGFTC